MGMATHPLSRLAGCGPRPLASWLSLSRPAAQTDSHDALANDVPELVLVRAAPQSVLERDEAALVELPQRLVHRLHPELLLAHLHRRVDLVHLVLADQVANGGVRH